MSIPNTPSLSDINGEFASPNQKDDFNSLMNQLSGVSLPQDFLGLAGYGQPTGGVSLVSVGTDANGDGKASLSVDAQGNGDSANWHLEWSTSSDFSGYNTGGGTKAGKSQISASGTSSFSEEITGLQSNATYYVRLVAYNAFNDASGYYYRSAPINFKTGTGHNIDCFTSPADNIAKHDARLSGSFSGKNFGTANFSFKFRKQGDVSFKEVSAGTSTNGTGFSTTIFNLTKDTTYEYYALASGDNQKSDTGSINTFDTLAVNPTLSCSSDGASSVSYNGATLNGSYSKTDISEDASVYFQYRPTSSSTWTNTNASTQAPGSFSTSVSLSTNTDYEFRAVASTSGKTDKGSIDTFSTPTKPSESISCSTKGVLTTTNSTASIEGSYSTTAISQDASVYFEYKKSSSSSWQSTSSFTAPEGDFSDTLSGLDSGTSYDFKAHASASGQSDSGTSKSFSTDAADPFIDVTTGGANSDDDGADVSGSFDGANFGSAQAEFKYREQGQSTWNYVDADNSPFSSPGSFGARVPAPSKEQKTFEYQARVTGDNSTGETGALKTFTTDRTYSIQAGTLQYFDTSITPNQAKVEGNISGYNYGTADYGFEYKKSGSSSWSSVGVGSDSNPKSESGLNAVTYETTLSGLDPDSTYDFRATVTGENGTGSDTGTTKSFSTPKSSSVSVSASNGSPRIKDATIYGSLSGYGFSNADVTVKYSAGGGYVSGGTKSYNSSADRTFFDTITGLQPDTSYDAYFQVSTDGGVSDTSETVSFETRKTPEWSIVTAAGPHDGTDSSGAYRIVCVAAGSNIGTGWLELKYRKSGSGSWNLATRNSFSDRHGDNESADKITTDITGLEGNTTYEYKAVAVGQVSGSHTSTINGSSGVNTFETT